MKWPSTSPRSIAAMMLLSLQTMSSTSRVKGIDWLVVGGDAWYPLAAPTCPRRAAHSNLGCSLQWLQSSQRNGLLVPAADCPLRTIAPP